MKVLRTKPFKIDPKARQGFTLTGTSKTFPIATKDAETIDRFVKEFTESIASQRGEKGSRLGRPAIGTGLSVGKRRGKALRDRDRASSRSSRIA